MDRELTRELVAERFARAAVVKSNPVREVRTDGEFYYKLDRRSGRTFEREFRAARLLEERRIPVVQHLWHGVIPAGALLVTRGLAAAPSVHDYLARHYPDAEFRRKFAVFIRDFLASGLGHIDLHVGNILYSTEEGRFVLVDVQGVRRRRRQKLPYVIVRAVLELRKHLRKDEVCEMLEIVGVPEAGRFFDRSLRIEAAAINRDWEKRRRQILSGYPKFTRIDGTKLVAVSATPEELENLAWRSGSEAEFVSAFYWELAEIPHERAVAFDREKREVGIAPPPFPTPLAPEEVAARRRVLENAW